MSHVDLEMHLKWNLIDNLLRIQIQGKVTFSDLISAIDSIQADYSTLESMSGIIDFSNTTLKLDFREITKVVDRLRYLNQAKGHWAILNTFAEYSAVLTIFLSLSGAWSKKLRMFTSLTDAERWISERVTSSADVSC